MMGQWTWVTPIDPLGEGKTTFKYPAEDNNNGESKNIYFHNLSKTLAANKLFTKDDIDYYNKFSRYGFIDPYNTEHVVREYLFFTKPDLNIFANTNYDSDLNDTLASIPFFIETNTRNKDALRQLQYSVRDQNNINNPFMYLLSNSVTSKLDLPSISAESKESTSNIKGISIQYRGPSYKSDNGYDFSLSFTDTAYLEIYTMVKAYDEYMRLLKAGTISPIRTYIINRIISEQFSIYKFLIGDDGETILYYAKLTGCYFTDVPRSDMSDPGNDGFKFSLSFHAQFVEDNNPMIINEFNRISPAKLLNREDYVSVYDFDNNTVDNSWVKYPTIIRAYGGGYNDDLQVSRRGTKYDYRMKWLNS